MPVYLLEVGRFCAVFELVDEHLELVYLAEMQLVVC
jgi:hypothetical protein